MFLCLSGKQIKAFSCPPIPKVMTALSADHEAPLQCGTGGFNGIQSSARSDMGHGFKQNLLSFLKENMTLKNKANLSVW